MSSLESSVKRGFRSQTYLVLLSIIFPLIQAVGQDSLSQRPAMFLLSEARKFQQGKNFQESIRYYKGYLAQQPEDDDVRNELARTYSWNAEYDSALATYDLVISRNRNNFDARYGVCQVLGWGKNYHAAILQSDTLLARFPRNIDAILLSAKLHLWNGNFTQSLELDKRVISLDQNNVEALLGTCRALKGLGRMAEAYHEIGNLRKRFPGNVEVEQLARELEPRYKNQMFVRYQNESFDVRSRSDHRTFEAQYYRSMSDALTIYAQLDAYRRFGQDDQSIGLGVYYMIDARQTMFGYVLASPDPRAISTIDASVEYTRVLSKLFSASVSYRLLAFTVSRLPGFKPETVHILSPGISLSVTDALELKPRIFVSRTIFSRTTSYAYSVQGIYNGWRDFTPFLYYTVGNEAYRGVTLDNVESSDSWSLTVGGKYLISKEIALRIDYQYLNRIGYFRENSLDIGLGYYW